MSRYFEDPTTKTCKHITTSRGCTQATLSTLRTYLTPIEDTLLRGALKNLALRVECLRYEKTRSVRRGRASVFLVAACDLVGCDHDITGD